MNKINGSIKAPKILPTKSVANAETNVSK